MERTTSLSGRSLPIGKGASSQDILESMESEEGENAERSFPYEFSEA